MQHRFFPKHSPPQNYEEPSEAFSDFVEGYASGRTDVDVYKRQAVVHFPFMNATMSPVLIALLNTVFRAATILVLLPFIKWIEKIVYPVSYTHLDVYKRQILWEKRNLWDLSLR